jgi:SulP family sulfate permease
MHARRVLGDLIGGAVVAAITLAFGFSFGPLFFPGPLAAGASLGIGMTLLGAGFSAILVAWRTSLPPAVGAPDTPVLAAISALAAVAVLPQVESGAISAALGIERGIALILLSSLLIGLGLLALGLARVGSALRFIPYPVVSGFMAGSGLFLALSAGKLILGAPLSLETLPGLFGPGALPKTAAVLALPAILFSVRRFWRPFYLLPMLFFVEIAVVHGALGAAGLSHAEATAQGWFLAPRSGSGLGLYPLWSLSGEALDGSWLLGVLPDMGAVVAVAAASVLLNASGLVVAWRRSADLDMDLKAIGLAGVFCGASGATVGSLSLSRSLLNVEAGGRGRLSGCFAGALLVLAGLFGAELASLAPLPVLAGLLLFLGLSLLVDRLAELPPRQPLSDYLLMLLIAGLIPFYGYLEGVIAGLVGACLFFAFTYSRIGIIKHILNRRERASDVERPLPQKQLLERHGERIRVVSLRGYIFFGTSNGLLDRVRGSYPPVRHEGPQLLILDFRSVSGIDSSAVVSFVRLAHFCEEWAIELCFADLADPLQRVIASRGDKALAAARRFASQDEALEHAEEVVLRWSGDAGLAEGSLERWFARDAQMAITTERLVAFLEQHRVEAGGVVFAQGEPSDTIELLVEGRVQVVLRLGDGTKLRLRTMLEQTVLGEMGFFRRLPRSASVVADQESRLYRVTRAAYERMLAEAPDVAAALHRVIIATLADRLAFANNEIAALKR